MTMQWKDLARTTLEGSETETMSFGETLRLLTEAGFDGYAVDYRRATRTLMMRRSRRVGVRCGLWCGRLERSVMPASPSCR